MQKSLPLSIKSYNKQTNVYRSWLIEGVGVPFDIMTGLVQQNIIF